MMRSFDNRILLTSKILNAPAVLLCGGQGKRMGIAKGLASLTTSNGSCTLLEYQMQALAQTGLFQVILVLGYQHEEYFKKFKQMEEALHRWRPWDSSISSSLQFQVVLNQEPHHGPFSSIQSGIHSLLDDHCEFPSSRGFFILPIDHPCPTHEVWLQISTDERTPLESPIMVRIPTFKGKGGHPIWIHRTFAQKLLTVRPNTMNHEEGLLRLDLQIKSLDARHVARMETGDPQILINLNTPHDISNWLKLRSTDT